MKERTFSESYSVVMMTGRDLCSKAGDIPVDQACQILTHLKPRELVQMVA